ncbi:MAG TPA: tripartite tricarboxylate transporter TctB family protein [Casimicrobiaceae bacterium]|nr:tripartite tricarboxylate transporter TctB family protein [Casimicrobiaceae bacterium]
MEKIRNPKDFWAGILFICLGVAAIWLGSAYTLGTAARMGPGYFPRILGILLIVLGSIVALNGVRTDGPRIPRFYWKPTFIVLGTVVIFGHIVTYLGLAISTVFLIVGASSASHEFRWKESIVIGVLLAALAVGVFIVGLHLQLPIWPVFIAAG